MPAAAVEVATAAVAGMSAHVSFPQLMLMLLLYLFLFFSFLSFTIATATTTAVMVTLTLRDIGFAAVFVSCPYGKYCYLKKAGLGHRAERGFVRGGSSSLGNSTHHLL